MGSTRTGRFTIAAPAAAAMALALMLPAGARTARGVPNPPLAPGDHRLSLEHKGRERSYLVHVPPQAGAGLALPVVLSFHGGGGTGVGQEAYSGMNTTADRQGFIAVYPNGTGRLRERLLTWNAGTCCGYAQDEQVDDVGFVVALLDHLAARIPVDTARVYATGLSNGAMMSYRLAAEASDRIAAIAPVAGGMVASSGPPRPVPVMHVHSVDDPRALYKGGMGPPFPFTNRRVNHPSVEATLARWVAYDGCPDRPTVEPTIQGRGADEGQSATRIVYGPCKEGTEVVHWKLTGAGHVWPGGRKDYLVRALGRSTGVIDVNSEIWSFFSRFRLPAPPGARRGR